MGTGVSDINCLVLGMGAESGKQPQEAVRHKSEYDSDGLFGRDGGKVTIRSSGTGFTGPLASLSGSPKMFPGDACWNWRLGQRDEWGEKREEKISLLCWG